MDLSLLKLRLLAEDFKIPLWGSEYFTLTTASVVSVPERTSFKIRILNTTKTSGGPETSGHETRKNGASLCTLWFGVLCI